jgi:hypothetical protein
VTTETMLVVLLIVLIAGALPAWPYSKPWGYAPTGILTILLVVFAVWAISNNRPLFKRSEQGIKAAAQDIGEDLKAAGRDAAETVRNTVK